MYRLKSYQKNLTSLPNAYENGLMTVKSPISQRNEVIDGTCTKNRKNKKEKSSMLVLRQKSNKMISVDKLNSLNKNTLNTKSSKISEVASTIKEPVSRGFWREYSQELSKKLWLPKKIDLPDSDMTYLNGFSRSMGQCSFVAKQTVTTERMNSQTILCPLSRYLQPDITVEENTNQTKIYCRKIRFYPDKGQKILFDKCFGATRYFHNKGLDYINDNPAKSYTHITLRENCMDSDKDLSSSEKWQSDIPYDTRQLSLKQLASNMKTNFTRLRKGQISHFEMTYKTKKNRNQVCYVNKKAFNTKTMRLFSRRLDGKISLKRRRNIKRWEREIKSVNCDFTVTREEDKYYLCIPQKYENIINIPKYDTVSLDPGVRTFQTFYSQEQVGKIGHRTSQGLLEINKRHDRLITILKEKTGRTARNIRKRCSNLRTKVKNIVTDLHWKTANYLCSTYKNILLPSFTVKTMTRCDDRTIPKSVVRRMLMLSHYKFKERLRYLCGKMGNNLYIVNEAYTSKTCGNCGTLCDVGGSDVFKCNDCKIEIDRDYNGSRNILLKHLRPLST